MYQYTGVSFYACANLDLWRYARHIVAALMVFHWIEEVPQWLREKFLKKTFFFFFHKVEPKLFLIYIGRAELTINALNLKQRCKHEPWMANGHESRHLTCLCRNAGLLVVAVFHSHGVFSFRQVLTLTMLQSADRALWVSSYISDIFDEG